MGKDTKLQFPCTDDSLNLRERWKSHHWRVTWGKLFLKEYIFHCHVKSKEGMGKKNRWGIKKGGGVNGKKG